jgi:uracil-DNA glycosylase
MLLSDLWHFFEAVVFVLYESGAMDRPTCNFYCEELPGIDRPGAAETRRKNLKVYVSSFAKRPSTLLLGEAPGWRGCRFSGIPFTSEALLTSGVLPFSGQQSSASPRPYREASATIFWETMTPYHPGFLAWNCFPLHPHQPGRPLSNRPPARQEISDYAHIVGQLVDLLAPQTILAVGKSASATLDLLGLSHFSVRHPAHGGAQEFKTDIERLRNHITI